LECITYKELEIEHLNNNNKKIRNNAEKSLEWARESDEMIARITPK
jgi:hypothetical protein